MSGKERDHARCKHQTHKTEGMKVITQLTINDLISYKWLFDIELRPPLEHTSLPFSYPIPKEFNIEEAILAFV